VKTNTKFCRLCGSSITPPERRSITSLCMTCGEAEARKVKHCIVPLAKSNYVVMLEVIVDRFDVVALVSGALFIFVLVLDYLELLT
jgi:predicted amidophosphoribosyltransferase